MKSKLKTFAFSPDGNQEIVTVIETILTNKQFNRIISEAIKDNDGITQGEVEELILAKDKKAKIREDLALAWYMREVLK
tara:strand:+ start:7644 stop:7880 length:237 start_codon:yes stop_codon:yes gene_type:complete